MGEPPDRIPETAATKIGIQTVKKVILHQSKYWKCLYPKGWIFRPCIRDIPAYSEKILQLSQGRSGCMVTPTHHSVVQSI